MSYQKKSHYPSVKTPGVYPNEVDKKIGLNTDDLKQFSLGNWNSRIKEDKIFPGNAPGGAGRPILISFDRLMLNLGMCHQLPSPCDNLQ